MRNDRAGESLWEEWSGEGFSPENEDSLIFYTIDHVVIHDEIPRRALAAALQRFGVVDALGWGYKAAESAIGTQGYSGYIEGENSLTACDEFGDTFYGDEVEEPLPTTWVEVYLGER